MNVLFMTIAYPNIGERNIYSDLMEEFERNNHEVYVACSYEKRNREYAILNKEKGINVLRIKTGNLTGKVNIIEKGISTILLENKFIKEIKTFFSRIRFDVIIYSTPPITLARAVEYFKKRDSAKTYLLLKDIFPQNAVDVQMMKYNSILYKFFRNKEKKLYAVSDYIGCMSQANVDYVLNSNRGIPQNKVEICPNSIFPSEIEKSEKAIIRLKYNIPKNCKTFIYGGNLGKPQGIDFVVECLKKNMNLKDRFFIVCGKGVDYYKLEAFCAEYKPTNVLLLNGLQKNEYDELVKSCDVGMIFLDHRFTIPNFPSRILSYMEYAMPIVACTDKNTDVGKIILEGNFGWWCESNKPDEVKEIIDLICSSKELSLYGVNARKYLDENYTVKISYNTIINHFK